MTGLVSTHTSADQNSAQNYLNFNLGSHMNNLGNSWSKFDLTNNSTSKDENLEEPKSIDGNSSKKHYSVTTDDSRKRFIELWNSGTITIKQAA